MAAEQHACDLIVVGGGPGGYVAAIRAAMEMCRSGTAHVPASGEWTVDGLFCLFTVHCPLSTLHCPRRLLLPPTSLKYLKGNRKVPFGLAALLPRR